MALNLEQILHVLQSQGLHAVLKALNSRTPHRFTGVYRYDGDMLRNVALFDRWDHSITRGADASMVDTFCAIVPSQGMALAVVDGHTDGRFPWMQSNPVVCYCGVLIRDDAGVAWGTVCHFDLQRCEAASTHLPELMAVAPHLYRAACELVVQ